MGQYFRGCILTGKYLNDKPIQFCPWDWDNGAKLMEHSYERNTMAKCFAYQLALSSEEYPVRAAWIGDYANEHLFSYPPRMNIVDDSDRFEALAIMYVKCWCLNGDDNAREALFDIKRPDDFEDLEFEYNTPIYVADLDRKEYILTYPDDPPKEYEVSRLNLLLAAFNGAGGSYYGNNMDMVGRWAGDWLVAELSGGFPEDEITWFRERLEKHGYDLDDFTELKVEFTEEY